MNDERLMNIILSPVFSEKSGIQGDNEVNQYAFKVLPGAKKLEIGLAVEKMFSVRVTDVRVLNVKGKVKRSGSRGLGKRKDWRKAYVRLKEGHEIEIGNAR
jgi:large subunit ribosomal protein L23